MVCTITVLCFFSMPMKPVVEGRDIEGDDERARQQVSQRERERERERFRHGDLKDLKGVRESESERMRARERV